MMTFGGGNTGTYSPIIYYSTDSGTTWSTTAPAVGTASTAPNNLVMIQWWLDEPLEPNDSGTASFDAQVPTGYIAGGGDPFIENCADARLGGGAPFAQACTITIVEGNNSIGDLVWADDGAGTGTSHNAIQDGTEAGIGNITVSLYWDRNGDGNLDAGDMLITTQDTVGGAYDFTLLPNGDYIVVVDTTDSDLPVGYGPTTQTEYAVTLTGGTDFDDADFGFGPSLEVEKILLSSDPAYEGDEVSFRIGLTNRLPGDGTASGFCTYRIWATIDHMDNTNDPPGGGPANAQWFDTPDALGAPDTAIATTEMNDNTDVLGLSGFNMGDQGGNITNVTFVVYTEEFVNLKATDAFIVRPWFTAGGVGAGAQLAEYTYLGDGTGDGAYFTSPVGTVYQVSEDITALRAWTWADFASNITEMQLEGNKGSGGGASGDIGVDAAAYIVTTDQTCGGADSTIATLPLTDTYDADLLQFVSADPSHTTNTTTGTSPNTVGTITWANMGPLYAGQTKYITVTFTALEPGDTTVNTINTASVTGAEFANGRPVNDDSDDADVDIVPTGSIAGVVYSDANSNGWQGTTGYEALGTTDFAIPGVTVTLYGCYDDDPANGGVLYTAPQTNRDCDSQQTGANPDWYVVGTTTTASDGSYLFEAAREGFYYVAVDSGTLPVGATQSAEAGSSATNQNGTGRTCGTCDHIWGGLTQNLTTGNFNPIGTNATTPNEDITNINFGYTGVPANIFGIVWSDENGDGDQDSGEGGITGATVRLCDSADCSGTVFETQLTGADGSYNFNNSGAGLTPGNYFVVVTQPANTTQTGDPDETGTCATCDNVTTTAVSVSAGESEGSYDFGYQPSGAATLGDTLYRDWNGNGSQDAGEEGLSNITVYLYEDEDNDGVIDPEDAIMATTSTDANGNYSFPNLPDGDYIIVVDPSDADYPGNHAQTEDADGACPSVTCDDQSTSANITGGVDDLDNDFGYEPQGFGSIGDYVWNDVDADGIQDAGEAGIDGVVVNLYEDQDGDGIIDPEDALIATMTTAGGGAYDFADLYPYTYIVEIDQNEFTGGQELEGMTMTTSGAAYTNNGTQVSYSVNLGAGEDFDDADFGFAEGIIGDFIWQDDNGNGTPDPGEPGIDGVTVNLYNDNDGNGVFSAGDTLVDTQVTAGGGLYEFGGLPAGDYVVVVTPPAGYTLTGDPDAYSTNPGVSPYPPCDPLNADYQFCDNEYGTSLLAGQVNLTADFGYQPSAYLGDTPLD